MRPNVAGRFSDFATNSGAMTSMSMLYSLSLCTCRTARLLSCCWLIDLRKYVFRRRSDEKLHSTKKVEGDQYIAGAPNPKVGGLFFPGPRGCCAYALLSNVRRFSLCTYTAVFYRIKSETFHNAALVLMFSAFPCTLYNHSAPHCVVLWKRFIWLRQLVRPPQ